jgi:hypothetical protein
VVNTKVIGGLQNGPKRTDEISLRKRRANTMGYGTRNWRADHTRSLAAFWEGPYPILLAEECFSTIGDLWENGRERTLIEKRGHMSPMVLPEGYHTDAKKMAY